MRIVAAIAVLVGLAVPGFPAAPQPADGIHRIGFLTWGKARAFRQRLAAFRQGMADLGYVEGKNFIMLERYAEGWRDRAPALAGELVRLAPDVIVTHGGSMAVTADRIATKAGRTIPVVFAVDNDPVGNGVVASLGRPGGNITGLSDTHSDLAPKRLALLKETFPMLSRVAVIYPGRPDDSQFTALRAAAPSLGLTILPVKLATPDDLPRVFDMIRKDRPGALNVFGYSLASSFRKRIAAFALETGLPTIGAAQRNAEVGYLMTYGTNLRDLYRRAAAYVDKILKGAKPADLPVEQPTRFYLTINLKTAKKLRITIPRSILLRADRVIE